MPYRLVTPRAPGRWLGNRRFADSRTGCRGILTSAGGRISHHRDLADQAASSLDLLRCGLSADSSFAIPSDNSSYTASQSSWFRYPPVA